MKKRIRITNFAGKRHNLGMMLIQCFLPSSLPTLVGLQSSVGPHPLRRDRRRSYKKAQETVTMTLIADGMRIDIDATHRDGGFPPLHFL